LKFAATSGAFALVVAIVATWGTSIYAQQRANQAMQIGLATGLTEVQVLQKTMGGSLDRIEVKVDKLVDRFQGHIEKTDMKALLNNSTQREE
jgi:hypothetical protein